MAAFPARRPACSALRLLAFTYAALIAATAIGVAVELADHGVAGSAPPHPTLHPSLQAIGSILATNVRVLAAPFLLIAFRFHTSTPARIAGDLLLSTILAANALRVGVALARWQTRLLPYLPHVPLEYSAAAVAATAWLSARRCGGRHQPQLMPATGLYAAVAAASRNAAAIVEVLLTPHAR
jgi:hypothetical protein